MPRIDPDNDFEPPKLWPKVLKTLRKEHRLTQAEAAERAGIRESNSWSRWELGHNVSQRSRRRIADAFGMSPRELDRYYTEVKYEYYRTQQGAKASSESFEGAASMSSLLEELEHRGWPRSAQDTVVKVMESLDSWKEQIESLMRKLPEMAGEAKSRDSKEDERL